MMFIWNRTRRRQAREQNGKRAEHKEGLSSDDEETSTDITSFNLERGEIQCCRQGISTAFLNELSLGEYCILPVIVFII